MTELMKPLLESAQIHASDLLNKTQFMLNDVLYQSPHSGQVDRNDVFVFGVGGAAAGVNREREQAEANLVRVNSNAIAVFYGGFGAIAGVITGAVFSMWKNS